jgi:D-lactate dehydrogenase (cytochrome)
LNKRYIISKTDLIFRGGLPSVPVSRLPLIVYETKDDLASLGIKSTIVGHVGDGKLVLPCCIVPLYIYMDFHTGNFHALLLFQTDEELALAGKAYQRLVHRAIAMDGTCQSYL